MLTQISSMGAVTPVGLSAPQTCAAIRARLAAFQETAVMAPPHAPILAAQVPARPHVKRTPAEWLVNLAVRALRECIEGHDIKGHETALFVALPDPHRGHAAVAGNPSRILNTIQRKLRISFHGSSAAAESGRAGVLQAIAHASRLLEQGTVQRCIVGGVDSLVNAADIERLRSGGRLHEPGNPQGVIPGEGAAFILLTPSAPHGPPSIAQLLGVGVDTESVDIRGERYAIGHGLRRALLAALSDARCAESDIAFRVSDNNGERYYAWDSLLASTRFYRTRREHLTVWYPALYTGDVGAAMGALDVIVAANALLRELAPGPVAMCEASSDEGVRAACLVASATDSVLARGLR